MVPGTCRSSAAKRHRPNEERHMNIVQRHPVVPATGRFAFSEAPIPGESLMGFIARNADIHGVDKVASALLPAGLENPKTEAFATAYEGRADVLAALFMTTSEEIRSGMYLPWAGREGTEVNFHGTHIRPRYLRWRNRRFSPASLRVSGHHRAMWDLDVLSFCPESKEMLVSGCPSCGESLGWRYTLGIRTCEWCEADLTKVASEPVRCHDIEALDFACDLVNPDPGRREKARARVPERLAALDTGELFEFVMNLACVILTRPDSRVLLRLQSKDDLAQITPDIIAEAGRLVMGWPASMHAYAAELRSRAHLRPGFWGVRKELGPLLWLTKEQSIASSVKEAVQDVINDNMASIGGIAQRNFGSPEGTMTTSEVLKEFGFKPSLVSRLCADGVIWSTVHAGVGKPVTVVRRQDISDLRAEMGDVTSRIDVAKSLGVDYLAVERLAAVGLLRKVGRVTAAMVYGDHYRTSSLATLRERLLALAPRHVRSGTFEALSVVARRTDASVVPWAGIVEAVLSHRVPVVILSEDHELPLTERLGILDETAWMAAELPTETLPDKEERGINTHEAGAILEIGAASISYLTQGGALPRSGSGDFSLKLNDVLAFRELGISTGEVARRTGGNGRLT